MPEDEGVLAARWTEMISRTPHSYFQTWHWIDAWRRLSPEPLYLFSLKDTSTDQDLALALLSRDAKGEFWLNAPSVAASRVIFCEYCDIVSEPAIADVALQQLIGLLDGHPIRISGSLLGFDKLETISGRRALSRQKREAPFVDLAAVRTATDGFSKLLSRNTRQQLSRATRLEGLTGNLRIKPATTREEISDTLDCLVSLQRDSFLARQKRSSFSSTPLADFISRLFSDNATSREKVELLSLYSGEERVGALLNLIWGKTVANYQGGFSLRSDPRVKLGYLSHFAAIEHYAKQGYDRYSFLAGDAQYKQSLATGQEMLFWTKLAEPTIVNWAENSARRLTGRLVT